MSTDYTVEIESDITRTYLVVHLSANDPNQNLSRKEFLRPIDIGIDQNNINDLRGGNPTEAIVQTVAKKLSDWLINDEMRGLLRASILGNGPVRFIFKLHSNVLEMLSDLPIELLHYENDWVVLRKAVSAIVHELPGTGLPKPFYQSFPLKILVVRSSPSGLAVTVPAAGPICNHIIKLAEGLGQNIVHVDLLSREVESLEPALTWEEFEAKHLPDLVVAPDDTNAEKKRKESLKWNEFRKHLLSRSVAELKPATWDDFTTQLRKSSTNYHILVYLGHGNQLKLNGSSKKTGVLQFEKPDGVEVDPVTSDDLQRELQQRQVAVPVVLLAGCLTAAEREKFDEEELKDVSGWSQGSQGVAQRLVDSASGVQCAVGMRYQIEDDKAFDFLSTFFESLLTETPGNVEAAVRAGRMKLTRPPIPPSWSAPVIFRLPGAEPMFERLADLPKTYGLDRDDVKDQAVREASWTALLQDPNLAFAYEMLDETENRIKDKVATAQGALLMPERKKATPGKPIEVAVSLFGSLSADKLTCKLSVSSDRAISRINWLRSTQAFRDSNFLLVDKTDDGSSDLTFTIKRGAGAVALPEGALIVAELSLDTLTPAKYTVRLDVLATEPEVKVRPLDNVVIVSGK